MQQELNVRKILGRTYLNENRLSDALDIFVKILMDYPDDLETLLILGGFYLAGGDGKTAKNIYLRAQQLDPGNKTIARQIMMAEELDEVGDEEPIPTDMEAVSRLLQRLTGKTNAIPESDIMRAVQLLNSIIDSENPAEVVSSHLDEIDDLLLALIEVNVRQARADGQPGLAEALQALQLNIDYQLDMKADKNPVVDSNVVGNHPDLGNILLLLPGFGSRSKRMSLLSKALESFGCHVRESDAYIPGRDPKPNVVIAGNPHTNPVLVDGLSALSAAGVPIIVDMDSDFENQPASHYEYGTNGLGSQARSSAYTTALSLADMVTVPSQGQAEALRGETRQIFIVPDGWSRKNRLWEKSLSPRSTVNIGWVGSSGQIDDLMLIRRFMVRIVREFPNTKIVIIGDPQAYRQFEGLQEKQRMYLPMVADEEFPFLLSQLDILTIPLRNIPYNLSQPDTLLMEAGARGIPWIASPVPAFREWGVGGVIAESLDEWHSSLRQLVLDQGLCKRLGAAGRNAAGMREMSQVGEVWLQVISQAAGLRIPFSGMLVNA